MGKYAPVVSTVKVEPKPEPVIQKIRIPFVKLHPGAKAPTRAHDTDAGFDLIVAHILAENHDENYYSFGIGIAIAIPDGLFADIRARSSIYKTPFILANGVGTIDAGYNGELIVMFRRVTDFLNCKTTYLEGDRCAQLVFPMLDPRLVEFYEVKKLPETSRGTGGFGSTGK